ncbi:hypothetical protein BP6252_06556 [Coleophoma cylindrospora]|uniref:Protein kinase domain-containing protein n=1 Tax=Coleophoma cylindrospora TaxID=1849047 RepID=A0A3D8RNE3_9HELO|nr:hypothetical protein BP6252_06556 [Coleophoma cylindrospora]
MSLRRSRTVDSKTQDLLKWIQMNSVQTCHRFASEELQSFIPFSTLSIRFEENKYELLKSLIGAEGGHESIVREITFERLKIFCILLALNGLDQLHHFLGYDDLKDNNLPFKLASRPPHFPIVNARPSFFEDFCSKQWQFCAPSFDYSSDKTFEDSEILPIISSELVQIGRSANIYKIKLEKSHNNLLDLSDENERESAPLALKTYRTNQAERFYDTEVAALREVSYNNPYIVRFHGGFKYRNTYNVLLEYADRGSLEHYWAHEEPPTTGKAIIKLWNSMFGLIRAVRDLNNGDVIYWHQDIKPDNILAFGSDSHNSSNSHTCTFKLADFGNSHSKPESAEDSIVTDIDTQGTRTYGAPECYRPNDFLGKGSIRVSPDVDIWSLGCVLSEFAVWLYFGQDGLRQYRMARKSELEGIPGFQHDDCFHDGTAKLSSVMSWHDRVREKIYESDTITELVLPMLDDMLQNASARKGAQEICVSAYKVQTAAIKNYRQLCPDDPIERELFPPNFVKKPKRRIRNWLTPGPSRSSYQRPLSHMDINQDAVNASDKPGQPLTIPRPSTALPLAPRRSVHTISDISHRPLSDLAYMSIMEAEQWRDSNKSTIWRNKKLPLRDNRVLNDLNGRDSVFIIDDSLSMKVHHREVTRVFSIMSYMIKTRDETGLDLLFAGEPQRTHNYTNTKPLIELVSRREFTGTNNLAVVLGRIFDEYVEKLRRSRHPYLTPVPGLNIYIFTDGLWRTQCNVVPEIDKIVGAMIAAGKSQNQVGLQFISFGNIHDGLARLDLLDTGLGLKFDIVDTTPSDGNLYKMIMGAIDKDYDYKAEGNSLSAETEAG